MKARKSGFTLIEILIVVIILGILAAIVIPQFTEASSEARESTLVSNLHTLRSQIGLYKVQHNDVLPDLTSSDTFETCLVEQTDVDGAAGTDFGPYMQSVPDNPFITDDATPLFVIDTLGGATPAAGDDTSHWLIDSDTGNIWANDSENLNGDDAEPEHSTL